MPRKLKLADVWELTFDGGDQAIVPVDFHDAHGGHYVTYALRGDDGSHHTTLALNLASTWTATTGDGDDLADLGSVIVTA